MLDRGGPPGHSSLLEVVDDRELADVAALRVQGLNSDMDQLLSAQFIVTGEYGTRSSTTLWTDNTGLANWREISFDERGEIKDQQEAEFPLSR